MYAVAFDLVVTDTEQQHPKGVSQAYADIGSSLNEHGFSPCTGTLVYPPHVKTRHLHSLALWERARVRVIEKPNFDVQTLYVTDNEDMANLLWLSKPYVPSNGFRDPYAIFALSVLNSGLILLLL